MAEFETKKPIELQSTHLEHEEGKESKSSWVDRLESWLPHVDTSRLQEYALTLLDAEITSVKVLASLQPSDLADLRIPTGHRAILLDRARAEVKHRTPVSYFSVCGNIGFKLHGMWDEIININLWQAVVGEFLASGIYVFCVNAIIVSSGLLVQQQVSPGIDDSLSIINLPADRYLSIAIGAGFAFAFAVYTFQPLGAGHVTPAITFAYLFSSAVTPLRWGLYLAAQLSGAIIGTGFVNTLSFQNFDQAQGGINIVQPGYTPGVSVGIETLTTFILVTTALAYSDGSRKAAAMFGPAALGFVVLACHLIALPINGASMNPARSFASSAIYHKWDAQWTYWLGPALGALIAVAFYEIFIRNKSIRHGHQRSRRVHAHSSGGHSRGHHD